MNSGQALLSSILLFCSVALWGQGDEIIGPSRRDRIIRLNHLNPYLLNRIESETPSKRATEAGTIAPKGKPDRRPANARAQSRAILFAQCVGPDGRIYPISDGDYRACVDGEINDLSAERDSRQFIQSGILFIP